MSARNRLENKAARRDERKTAKAVTETAEWVSIYERLLAVNTAS